MIYSYRKFLMYLKKNWTEVKMQTLNHFIYNCQVNNLKI